MPAQIILPSSSTLVVCDWLLIFLGDLYPIGFHNPLTTSASHSTDVGPAIRSIRMLGKALMAVLTRSANFASLRFAHLPSPALLARLINLSRRRSLRPPRL